MSQASTTNRRTPRRRVIAVAGWVLTGGLVAAVPAVPAFTAFPTAAVPAPGAARAVRPSQVLPPIPRVIPVGQGFTDIDRDRAYDYVPSIVRDGGSVRAFWCTLTRARKNVRFQGGDMIVSAGFPLLSSQAERVYGDVDEPTDGPVPWDSNHTCDPSAIRADDGWWYVYYTGNSVARTRRRPDAPLLSGNNNGIGVFRWRPGQAAEYLRKITGRDLPSEYGEGQPSVARATGPLGDNNYYMIYRVPGPGAGLLRVKRSNTPDFAVSQDIELNGGTEDGASPAWVWDPVVFGGFVNVMAGGDRLWIRVYRFDRTRTRLIRAKDLEYPTNPAWPLPAGLSFSGIPLVSVGFDHKDGVGALSGPAGEALYREGKLMLSVFRGIETDRPAQNWKIVNTEFLVTVAGVSPSGAPAPGG